ncbi:MAG: hypothetical protein CL822_00790 [Crocinitomicaceae bacterium]|nr:hypothetical protein [Crocinitomicaceae bacterium]
MPEADLPNRKRVLFLHPNFPAQFKHLASAAAASGHDARFLCQTHYGRTLPGVQRLTLKGECGHDHLNALGGDQVQRSTALAKQYRQGLINLQSSGWTPDVVISHSGWGCGLHVREVWPDCRHIAYLEWWFDPESAFFAYDPDNHDLNLNRQTATKLWLRNQSLALELVSADAMVAPTLWQARQLPTVLRERCHVIHDGVDLERFNPDPTLRQPGQPILTYGTRGMEPMRAFPQFIAGLLPALESNPDLKVEIAGEDQANYGGRLPQGHESWGQWAKHQLSESGLSDRVKWVGYLSIEKYVHWLQASHCHVYLTHPFVASWSLLEALACQCPLVVSDVEPVRELCEATKSPVAYVDHRDPAALPKAIASVLSGQRQSSAQAASPWFKTYHRRTILEQWSHVAGLKLTTQY